jgi:hypothetical protein
MTISNSEQKKPILKVKTMKTFHISITEIMNKIGIHSVSAQDRKI